MSKSGIDRIATGIPNLDRITGGGLPKNSVTAICGAPGTGKTILAQQICCHNMSPQRPVLFFNTLSEPALKTLRFLQEFRFFDPASIDTVFHIVDLGETLQEGGLEMAYRAIMSQIKQVKPAFVVIDSFKVFGDFARSPVDYRKFGYQLAVNLLIWEVTALLVGEYASDSFNDNPVLSIVDGIIALSQNENAGEQQRFIHISKLRGSSHELDSHSFRISERGIEVFAPRLTIRRGAQRPRIVAGDTRLRTGISKLDDLLGEGIPRGSSILIAGVAGTGKTVMLLEFLYRGAKEHDEKGIFISFEETPERLLATAAGLGWDMAREVARGMIEIVFTPQPDIAIEPDMQVIADRVATFEARRVAVDSASLFLHKIREPQQIQEHMFELTTVIYNAGAVGFLATDIPYGSQKISRWGVEETIADGVILLSSTLEGSERQRYIEVYKIRNTANLQGQHDMVIGPGGLHIYPRYRLTREIDALAAAPPATERLPSGVVGLEGLIDGGFQSGSVTLVAGPSGTGKTVMGLQFLLAGALRQEHGLFISLEEPPAQIIANAESMGLPLRQAMADGLIMIEYMPREVVRAGQFLAVLSDMITSKDIRRLTFDDIDFAEKAFPPGQMPFLLHRLGIRFKALGVTSLFTLATSGATLSTVGTLQGYSPLSDNLIVLTYAEGDGLLAPRLTVIKTRGGRHDWHSHPYTLGRGGLRVHPAVADTGAAGG